MSIVISAHNGSEIAIAWDGLSRSGRTGNWEADETVEKVGQINPSLAFMITGNYVSDKLAFIGNFVRSVQAITELDTAFWSLFERAERSMKTWPKEGFRLGLAGFNAGVPDYKCITAVHSKGIVAEGASVNHYISGEADPVMLCEQRVLRAGINSTTSTDVISTTLRDIVTECIVAYPQTLGEPVKTLVLTAA